MLVDSASNGIGLEFGIHYEGTLKTTIAGRRLIKFNCAKPRTSGRRGHPGSNI